MGQTLSLSLLYLMFISFPPTCWISAFYAPDLGQHFLRIGIPQLHCYLYRLRTAVCATFSFYRVSGLYRVLPTGWLLLSGCKGMMVLGKRTATGAAFTRGYFYLPHAMRLRKSMKMKQMNILEVSLGRCLRPLRKYRE